MYQIHTYLDYYMHIRTYVTCHRGWLAFSHNERRHLPSKIQQIRYNNLHLGAYTPPLPTSLFVVLFLLGHSICAPPRRYPL